MELVLLALIAIPVIGGLLSWWAEKLGLEWPRWIALISMSLDMFIVIYLWATMDFTITAPGVAPHWLLEWRLPWIPRLGISIHLAMDGLSLLMVGLTALLGVMSVGCSWREIQRHVGFFHLNLLLNLAGVIGVFMAIDLFLFFFFWEVMLVPMYFLIALWGHATQTKRGRVYAATKFFIFTQASGLLMLLSILALVFVHHRNTGVYSFDYMALLGAQFSPEIGMLLMLGFFTAFAVKLPAFPFHPWLPDAHSQAPTAGSVDLAGVLLKTGAYGLLRFAVPLFPEASVRFADIAMTLGVIGIIYGALLAFAQTDVKRLVAYTSVSHMGFVLVGIYSGSLVALQGVVLQMLAHGISTGALFILCGELYERVHTRDLRKMGGLWKRLPHLAAVGLFFAVASLGMPGLGNFLGEFLVLMGAFGGHRVLTAFAALGLVMAAVYSLIMVQKAFQGAPQSDEPLEDLTSRELSMMALLIVLLVGLGLYPQPVLNTAEDSLQTLVHAINPPNDAYAQAPTAEAGL